MGFKEATAVYREIKLCNIMDTLDPVFEGNRPWNDVKDFAKREYDFSHGSPIFSLLKRVNYKYMALIILADATQSYKDSYSCVDNSVEYGMDLKALFNSLVEHMLKAGYIEVDKMKTLKNPFNSGSSLSNNGSHFLITLNEDSSEFAAGLTPDFKRFL